MEEEINPYAEFSADQLRSKIREVRLEHQIFGQAGKELASASASLRKAGELISGNKITAVAMRCAAAESLNAIALSRAERAIRLMSEALRNQSKLADAVS